MIDRDARVNEVLTHWFSNHDRWWNNRNADFDDEIRRRFSSLRDEILNRKHEGWRETSMGAHALAEAGYKAVVASVGF